jgi:hypothetical protein
MKKIPFIFMIVLVAVVVATNRTGRKEAPSEDLVIAPMAEIESKNQDEVKLCYVRTVVTTAEAPYSVHERIELFYDDATHTVRGTKVGTQSGPDMTNGYEGTLEGSIKDEYLTALFSYTIEGSKQKEQEIYVWPVKDPSIAKRRYPLIEKNGILVPDTTKPFIDDEVYDWVDCV